MNTREREVMDALAEALRGVHPNPGLSTTLAAYDALLAEGSASSEGAEAVDSAFNRPMFGRMIEADFEQSTATFEMEPGYYAAAGRFEIRRPQPAQGEPESGLRDAYEGAREDLLDWKGRAQRAEARLRNLGWAGVDASEPPSGEHEQRSCEGSERRPIAESDVSRACEVFDAATFYSIGGYTFDDYRKRMRAALESAHPRGLPAGSDAQLKVIDEVIRLLESPAVMPSPLGGINYAPEYYFGLLHDFKRVRTELATAEQPSCRQDARIKKLRETLEDIAASNGGGEGVGFYFVEVAEKAIASDDAAIAAQQRQGGGSNTAANSGGAK